MKRLKKVSAILIILTALQASSQSAIRNDSIVISKDVARKVLIDLADYDRLKQNNTEANLKTCIEIQKEKDTLINIMAQKNIFFQERILLTEKQMKITEEQIRTANNKNGEIFLFGGLGLITGFVIGFFLAQ